MTKDTRSTPPRPAPVRRPDGSIDLQHYLARGDAARAAALAGLLSRLALRLARRAPRRRSRPG